MRPVNDPPRTDPAPSRWAYRYERLMLTPAFRKVIKVGVPFCVMFMAGTLWLSSDARQQKLSDMFAGFREQIETRPEFMVNLLAVEGASKEIEGYIRELFPYDLPISSFDLELDAVRELVESLPAVADASLRIRQGGVVVAQIEERQPVALWRNHAGLNVVDIEGITMSRVTARSARPDLPVLAGDGADAALIEAMELLRTAKPLGERVKGLVRMGERRWDVVLDRNQRILLPAVGAVAALERVIVLDQVQDMLAKDLAVVDMRLSDRPTIRMTQAATQHWLEQTKTSAEAN